MVGSSVTNAMFPVHAFQPLQYRHIAVTTLVVVAHAGVLWLAHTALQNRPAEVLIPAQVIMELAQAAPQPLPSPAPTPAPAPQQPVKNRTVQRPTPAPQPAKAELPAAVPAKEPSPVASLGSPVESESQAAPAAQSAPAVPVAAAPAVPAAPAAPRIELPSTQADYLNNPKPPYPPLSKRLREEGKVVVRVLIEPDGTASKAEIRTSSGFDRLDQTALQTVLRWRYVPGKRNGTPEAMWFNVPINFVLE
jgi:protein TonB